MSHPGELLSAYLDGELSHAEVAEVLRHLDDCGSCRDELSGLDAARAAVRALPVLDPPVLLVPSTEDAVVVPLRSRRRQWVPRVAAAAAAAVLVVASVGAIRGESTTPALDLGPVIEQHNVRASVDPGLPSLRSVSLVQPGPVVQP